MCLAIPMKVEKIEGTRGTVTQSGVETEVSLDLIEEVTAGDWVIVHAGYAIQRLSEDDAMETLAILSRLADEWANEDAESQ